jgi:hypothetical protein
MIQRLATFSCTCLAFGALSGAALTDFARCDESTATRDVEVGAIVMSVPASWQSQKPSSRMRLAQFSVPAVEGDEEPAELAVFSFPGGGSARANVQRWIGQFDPNGRKATVSAGKSRAGEYVIVDVQGTYQQPVGGPFTGRTKPFPGARMLAVVLEVENQPTYFLKLVGKHKTVTAAAADLRAAIGADKSDERPFDLERGDSP